MRRLILSLAALLACMPPASHTHASGGVRTIALSGQRAPGTGEFFESFDSPVMNYFGRVAYSGRLTGDPSHDSGIWSDAQADALSLVIREDQDELSGRDSVAGVTRSGYIGFTQYTPTGGFAGLVSPTGEVSLFSNFGALAQDKSPILYALNDRGDMSISQFWFGNAHHVIRNGHPEIIVQAGDSIDGINGDFGSITGIEGAMNQSGDVVLRIHTDPFRDEAIIVFHADGTKRVVAVEGDTLSGDSGEPLVLQDFTQPTINTRGEVAFSTRDGWVSEGGGLGLRLVAQTFDNSIPGLDSFFLPLVGNFPAVSLNDRGQSAVSTRNGIVVDTPSETPRYLEITGASAPGTDVEFSGLSRVQPTMNVHGQLAFVGYLAGEGVDDTNIKGIWGTNHVGVLTKIVREGDVINLSDDEANHDLRTIAEIDFRTEFLEGSSNADGRPSAFNDRGQVAFGATFTDGTSGIFVSDAVAVLAGDYNDDGVVDGGDYAVWRNNLGAAAGTLPNDIDGDVIGDAQLATWRDNYGGTLLPEPVTILEGDYNNDGIVDGADYAVLREHLGQPAGTLPNDLTNQPIGQSQLAVWRATFGSSLAGIGSAVAPAPEPASLVTLMAGFLVAITRRRGRSVVSQDVVD